MIARDVSFSVPADEYARIEHEAHAAGFFGRCAVSQFARAALFGKAGKSGVESIIAQPTSAEQRREFVDYSKVKGHASVEAFALHSMATVVSKNKLTPNQKAIIARMRGSEAVSVAP